MLNNLPFDFLFPVNRSVVTLSSCHSFLESEPHVQVDFLDLPEDTPWGQASLTALQSLWMVTNCPLSGLQTWCYEKSPRGGSTFPTHPGVSSQRTFHHLRESRFPGWSVRVQSARRKSQVFVTHPHVCPALQALLSTSHSRDTSQALQ